MEDLKKKIVSLIGTMGGGRDLDFLCLAFQKIPRGDIAVAVLELCLDGRLIVGTNGIAIAEPPACARAKVLNEEAKPAPTTMAPAVMPNPAPQEKPPARPFEPEIIPDIEYPASALRADDSVDMLRLSTRSSNSLARLNITTISQLIGELSSLAGQPGIGIASLDEIEVAISRRTAKYVRPLGRRTVAELRKVSGNRDFSFDAFGTVVAIRTDNGWTDSTAPDIEELHLGDAATRRLRTNGIETMADLLATNPRAFSTLPHVGNGLVAKIRVAIAANFQDDSFDACAWQLGLGKMADVEELLAFGGAELRSAVETVIESCEQRSYPICKESLRVLAAEFLWQQIDSGHSVENATDLLLGQIEIDSWHSIENAADLLLGQIEIDSGHSVENATDLLLGQIEKADALVPLCLNALKKRCERALAEDCGATVAVPDTEPWKTAAAEITTINGVPARFDLKSNAIRFSLASVSEWIKTLGSERSSRYIRMRLEGKTLQEISDMENITRERVRQITESALEGAYPLAEDCWRRLFEAYDLEPYQFKAITGLETLSYGYLSITAKSKKADRKPLASALEDENIPEQIKEIIRNGNILPGYVYVDGKFFKATKQGIVEHLLLKKPDGFCMTADELYDEYCAFLDANGLERSGRLDPTSPRAFTARVERLSDVMFAKVPADEEGNRRGIRYYDSNARDFTPLTQAIGELAASRDVEVSAETLISEPALSPILEDLDIRNGYELHHVLSTWCPAICGVSLGRSPMLTLGEGDRRRQILALISEIGPADPNVLAEEYSKRYGVRPPTFKANFLNGFEQYNHDGLYSYEAVPLDDAQLATLRAILAPVQGWCSASKVRTAFLSHYPNWSAELVTTENMAKVGFEISDGLLVRHGFDLRAAFVHMVCDPTSFELGKDEFQPEVCSNSIFVSELNKAIRQFEIIEVRRGKFLSCREFANDENVMSPKEFSAFVDRTIARMVPGRPYSVKSLRALGLMGELDAVRDAHGFDDFFEESILSTGYVGGSLKRTSTAFTALFARATGRFTICDVVDWYVLRRGSLGVTQLADLLEADHGAKAQLSNLRFAIQRSSMTFDVERDMALLPDGMALLDEGPELLPEATSEAAVGATEPAAPTAEPEPEPEAAVAPDPEPKPEAEPEIATDPEPKAAPEATTVPADEVTLARIARVEEELAQVNASLAKKERLHQEYRELGREIPALEDEVRSYGFFRRDGRQEAQARLSKARARYASLKGEGSGMGTLRRRAEMLHNELNELRTKLGDR